VFFVTCGLVVGVLFTILTVGAMLFVNRASSRVAAELARIRAAGEPVSGAELEEHYRLPPGVEDTTELWLDGTRRLGTEAFRAHVGELPIVGTGWSEIPPPGEPWDDLEAAEELLRMYGASLRTMHEAAELGGTARYPIDFTDGPYILPNHVMSLRSGVRLLKLEAHVCAHRGDPPRAAKSIRTIFALAQSLEREPMTMSLIVRLATDGNAREQLQILLPTVDFSDADLAGLQDTLRAIDYHDGLYQAMLGERAMGIDAFENPDSLGEEVRTKGLWRFTQGSGFAFYLEHMDRLVVAARKPWPQALQAAEQARADREDRVEGGSLLTRMTHVFLSLVGRSDSGAFISAARHAAWNGEADAAIGVERYRRQYGKLPERLEELVPDFLPQVPIDPFDGQPLRYVVREEEYRVYSVGYDRVDNGGDAYPKSADSEPDIVFRVLRTP